MRSRGACGSDAETRRRNHWPRGGLRRHECLDRRRRQRCRQQHATDTARIDANMAAAIVLRRGRPAGGIVVANDRSRTGRRQGGGGAACRPACDHSTKRQRVCSRERNDAPPQRPSGEVPVHVETSSPQGWNTLKRNKFRGQTVTVDVHCSVLFR